MLTILGCVLVYVCIGIVVTVLQIKLRWGLFERYYTDGEIVLSTLLWWLALVMLLLHGFGKVVVWVVESIVRRLA